MHRVRKYFRGSGRALSFIFVASVIWLIFDMVALRFSFNEMNSKLHSDELFKREQGGSESWKPPGRLRGKWGNGGQPRGEDSTKLKGIFHPPGDELGKVVYKDSNSMFRQRKRTMKPIALDKMIAPMGVPGAKLSSLGLHDQEQYNKLKAANVTQRLEAKVYLSKAPAKENFIIKQNVTASVVREGGFHNVDKLVESVTRKIGDLEDPKILNAGASRDVVGGRDAIGSKDALEGKDGGAKDAEASKKAGESNHAVEIKDNETSKIQGDVKGAEASKKAGEPLDPKHVIVSKDEVKSKEERALEHDAVAKDVGDLKPDIRAFKDTDKVKDKGAAKVIVEAKDTRVFKDEAKDKEAEGSKVLVKGQEAGGSKVVVKGQDAEGSKVVVKGQDAEGSKVVVKGRDAEGSKVVVKGQEAEGSKVVVKGQDAEGSKVVVKGQDAEGSKVVVKGQDAEGSKVVVKGQDAEGSKVVVKGQEAEGSKIEGKDKDAKVAKVIVKENNALDSKIAIDDGPNALPANNGSVVIIKKAGAAIGEPQVQETVKMLNISKDAILPATHSAGVDVKNSRIGFKGGILVESENEGVKGTLTKNITHKLANVNISSSINADVENKQLIHHGQESKVIGTGMHKVRTLDATVKPRDLKAPGQLGRPMQVPKDKEQEANKRWKEGNFNVYLSDIIPLDRAIEDTRPKGCSNQLIHDDLPNTSIIMCFVDEVWSTLLRSVFSALNRSPPELIKEIILVDDCSTKAYLKEKLDEYMKQYPKVRILHLKERHGLIRARIAGANIATGDVLTFLDSHVECNVGWLEPLLEQVRVNRKKVACPVIEVISDKDMSYMTVDNFQRGIFSWPMNFGWKPIPTAVLQEKNMTEMDPIKCPVMAGGLFSIDKKYFYELGTYDPGLDVWGGENMEISFKIWMCGGEIEIIPCSRVGHIFRNDNPYSFPKDRLKTVERNLARVAEVWLDEYKEIFYGHGYHLLQEISKIGDLTQQKELRKKLQCKSFKWYIDNVFPDLDAPLARASGVVVNIALGKCLSLQNFTLILDDCDASQMNQHFNFTWLRQFKQKSLCIAPGGKDKLALLQCDNQNSALRWLHKSLTAFQPALESHFVLESIPRPTCLEVDPSHKTLRTNACDPTNKLQKWQFEKYFTP
ncbi:polypeptide N-acetylgalactosaminyltransferase 5 [Rana temporaria]|uniref:polypeptide N-acetylgalactosaminyltransferase 5 n=1 Tax=Rana temporaria TaxID=8407 RepID=UPI001AAC84D8|nr:polypeptide N-acetylgalactosaminyltransferase 5 [Rana temporaria]